LADPEQKSQKSGGLTPVTPGWEDDGKWKNPLGKSSRDPLASLSLSGGHLSCKTRAKNSAKRFGKLGNGKRMRLEAANAQRNRFEKKFRKLKTRIRR
jgi:hypothetical protein